MKKIRNQVIKFRTAVTMKALQAKEKLSENTGRGMWTPLSKFCFA